MVGQPFGLDFGAVMSVGIALKVDAELLATVLPSAEAAIVANLLGDETGPSDEGVIDA